MALWRATARAVRVASDPPLTVSPVPPGPQPASSANHRITWCSTCTAAWLPPATLGFMVAARASATIPNGCGGEFTQP
jgi:hypothetical protein